MPHAVRGPALALVLAATASHAAPPWPEPATWRLRVDQTLDTARWRGAVPQSVDRFDVRHRMQIDGAFGGEVERAQGLRPRWQVLVSSDFEVAADLGPDAVRQSVMPDFRRPALDIYHLNVQLEGPELTARLGRVLLFDALGLDAVDGATAELRPLPYVAFTATAGFAVRRAWSGLGPDLFSPDGTALPTGAAGLFGAGIALRDVHALDLRLDWRRQADTYTQREQIGTAAAWRPLDGLWLDAGLRYDLVFLTDAEIWLGAGVAPLTGLRLEGGWRRLRPLFSADSIWNAFGAAASDALELRGRHRLGSFTLAADGALRFFHEGDDTARAPGLTPLSAGERRRVLASPEPDHGLDAGAGLSWDFERHHHPASLGGQVRVGTGFGGQRHLADVFAVVPFDLRPGQGPLEFRPRLGILWFVDPDRTDRDGPAGWAVLAARWRAAESVSIETLVEGTASEYTPYRLRAMTHLRLEDFW